MFVFIVIKYRPLRANSLDTAVGHSVLFREVVPQHIGKGKKDRAHCITVQWKKAKRQKDEGPKRDSNTRPLRI